MFKHYGLSFEGQLEKTNEPGLRLSPCGKGLLGPAGKEMGVGTASAIAAVAFLTPYRIVLPRPPQHSGCV